MNYLISFSVRTKKEKVSQPLQVRQYGFIKKAEKALPQAAFSKNPVISFSVLRAKGKTSFKRMRFFLWSEINLFEICEMCFARKRTTFGCCEMPAGVRRFISFHIAAKTQYITMHSTLVCEALFHILRQQNISLKTNRWRPAPTEPAGENVGDYGELCFTASELFAP